MTVLRTANLRTQNIQPRTRSDPMCDGIHENAPVEWTSVGRHVMRLRQLTSWHPSTYAWFDIAHQLDNRFPKFELRIMLCVILHSRQAIKSVVDTLLNTARFCNSNTDDNRAAFD